MLSAASLQQKITWTIIGVAFVSLLVSPISVLLVANQMDGIRDNESKREYRSILNDSIRNYKDRITASIGAWMTEKSSVDLSEDIGRWRDSLLGFGNTLSSLYSTQEIVAFDSDGKQVDYYRISDEQNQLYPNLRNIAQELVVRTIKNEQNFFQFAVVDRKLVSIFSRPVMDEDEMLSHVAIFVSRSDKIFESFQKTVSYKAFIELEGGHLVGDVPDFIGPQETPDDSQIFHVDGGSSESSAEEEQAAGGQDLVFEIKKQPCGDIFGVPCSILVAKDVTEATSASNTFYSIFSIMGLIAIVAFGLASRRLGQSLSRPIKETIVEISKVSDTVVEVARSVQGSSKVMSEISDRLQSVVQETSSASEEIGSMMKNTKSHSEKSRQEIDIAENMIQGGSEDIRKVLDSVEEIKQSNQSLRDVLTLVKRISKETKVIDEIVFKTQLLSVNASIEASQAGQAGKGFEVVASEISSLANLSGEASEKIRDSVEQGVHEIEDLVSLTLEKVKRGQESSQSSAQSFGMIKETLAELMKSFMMIMDASEEQKIGLELITKSVQDLHMQTNKNLQGAHELTDSTEKLNQATEDLGDNIRRLKTFVDGKAAA
ncbi:methyl-accepting chemotaxis protein [Pseudobacteriovorax antillogorgiicola]|uniref:Methyl-accepting chemotaxis protein (MCP) signalling domain-containing protein n=1 Tax=Pseudobacteriovorax antillogorgiicola TaxID=1513793 RepID=A0A1Y6CF34_9BACT|nr:methyl-accepting chemotaxis protein [Pseudobacteriovorax antillogorgiicola]TCS49092.1 methyl-accepting chemotaxis protein (MCP) signaling protein [Pseudobacteriovorax antillogorgiicola]SMF51811.1 Methyl-accepting chemotaxis protein (MCP) signalling domain-containing protein [Pseudobacteriovorax antillogorgiicola]